MGDPRCIVKVPHEQQVPCGGVVEGVVNGGHHHTTHKRNSPLCHTKLQHSQLAQQQVAAARLIQRGAVKEVK